MNVCVIILILKMEEHMQHFWHIILYYFKKHKMQLKQSKRFVQCMKKMLWLVNVSKLVCKVSCWRFLPGGFNQSSRPIEVDSNRIKTWIENDQHYTMWEIACMFKIPKSIKLLVKMKNVSFILWKKPYRLFGQPNICSKYHGDDIWYLLYLLLNNVSFSLEFYSHLLQIISVRGPRTCYLIVAALKVSYNNVSIFGSVF